MPKFERHVFVCTNQRPEGAPRPSCAPDGTSPVLVALQQAAKAAGLGSPSVRMNRAGCMDQCEHGPMVVVYPEAVWYGKVAPEDAEEIVREHLIGGKPVERLVVPESCLNTKCEHRA